MATCPSATDRPIHVLLVDDEQSFREALARRLELRGFTVSQAADGAQADRLLGDLTPDVVVCDLKMPHLDGTGLIRARIANTPATAWIILTGQPCVESAVGTLKLGAAEYLQKPIDIDVLEQHIQQAYQGHAPGRLLAESRDHLQSNPARFGIVGRSRHVAETYEFIVKAARSENPVLITGDSGTGKELVARGVHEYSDRASRTFVTVNCAALSEELLADELLGRVAGAYPGAVGTKQGLLEVADGGTLLIDEVGELSAKNQAALLRVIASGQLRRLGDVRERVVDVRIIAATIRDLSQMVAGGTFRVDLYQRLNVLPFRVQSLRERPEDIPLLVQHVLAKHARRTGQPKRLSPEAMVALMSHDWPGNVRELANAIERAATLCHDHLITSDDLNLGLTAGVPTAGGLSTRLEDVEREHIARVFQAHQGNKLASAKALGISRMKLYRKLEQYQIS